LLINTIIKESASGASLKAEIRSDDSSDYSVKYYINGELSKITRYPLKNLQQVEENVSNWIEGIENLNG
jgi:hypothetical protein